MGQVTAAGLRPGDVVVGWTVVKNEPMAGSDGGVTHHRILLQDDAGNRRSTILARGRKFDIKR